MSRAIERAVAALHETAPHGYYVGGCVRDWLLGHPLKDLDVAVPERVEEIGRQTADRLGGVFFWLRREMNVARILLRAREPLQIDIVPLAGSIDADLRRRDFTINAMAVSTADGLVPGAVILDPTGGQHDLAGRRLRLAGPDALAQDPLRCLRAFRLRARLGLSFDPSVEPALRSAGPLLGRVSGERIRDELFVLLEGKQTAPVMAELLAHDLIASWSPLLAQSAAGCPVSEDRQGLARMPSGVDAARELDRWLAETAPATEFVADLRATLEAEVTPPRSRLALARLAALSAGAGSQVGRIPGALCLSSDEARVVTRAVQGCDVLRQAPPAAGRERLRFFQRWEPGAVEAALLAIAAGRAENAAEPGRLPSPEEALIDVLGDLLERRLRPVPSLVTGEEVMAILQLAPGPAVGQYLQEVEERRADGALRTAEDARAWLRERRQP